ncbi:MAG: oligosaccharide flippase family protein [Bacteriovoracaceae bacterium]|jgi:O-antigen/teichoic acid export membrane protein|nr:hypothetical protein [Halobacteriovoraceae bacterium]MDP7319707.1 oligosaccharide flippase family protein [Bacteriovoracaceae bacterium]
MKIGHIKKKLLIALSGTALAQVIHLLFTPILTRVYTPKEFGELALLIALSGISAALATGKYDLAIIVANNNEKEALNNGIKKLSIIVSIILIIFALSSFFLENEQYTILFLFLSLISFYRGKYLSQRAILNTYGKYSHMATGKIIENTSNGILALLLSFLGLSQVGLMLAKTLSFIIPAYYYESLSKKLLPRNLQDPPSSVDVFKKYKNFPKYSVLSELLTQLNLGFAIFAFTYLYGKEIAGHISMTTRVLSLPINFIGLAFLDVFKEKATHDYFKNGNFKSIFLKFFYTLSALGLLGFLAISLWGEFLFEFVLGEQWKTAGTFATIAILLYSIRLVSSPLGFAFYLVQKQKQEMFFKISILLFSILSLTYAANINASAIYAMKIYCYCLSLIYLFYISYAYVISSKRNTKNL